MGSFSFCFVVWIQIFSVIVASNVDLTSVEKFLIDNADEHLGRLIEFLAIPSVSADEAHTQDMHRAAQWLIRDMQNAGLENIQVLQTKGHPSVYGDWLHALNAPTILIYGHFDVQPEDPVSEWTSPPFEATVRNNRLYARGASDDKGHMYVVIAAIRAYLKTVGHLPVNVKVLFEGEEEIGSPNLRTVLEENKELLRTEMAFSADGGQVDQDVPGLCIGLRGAVALEVVVKVANGDMHSGTFGGGVQNPILALADIMASMRNQSTGRVLVDGFYDDVAILSNEERLDIEEFPLDSKAVLKENGINQTVGEEGFSFFERTWARPSLDLLGITGGFQGSGIKTVLPRTASAKISSRIVPNQSADKIIKAIKDHINVWSDKLPGIDVKVIAHPFRADPFVMSKRTVGNSAAAKVLLGLYGRSPVYFRMGGSIPAMALIREVLDVETTMFAFGGSDENVHAPDEFARLSDYRRGEKGYVRLFSEIANLWSASGMASNAGEEKTEL